MSIEEHVEKERLLFEQLRACPLVELTGVVGPSGVGGGRAQGQELWTLVVSLEAWRIDGGALRIEPLRVRRQVSKEELVEFQSTIQSESIIRIHARIAEENAFESIQAMIEEYLGEVVDDAELQAFLVDLQKPKTYEDPQFGTFNFDRQVTWFSASTNWNSETVDLNLNAESPKDIEACLDVARSLWTNQRTWKQRIEDFAVEELLPLKNNAWLGDDETECSPAGFRERMRLTSISIYPDGDFEFWHLDGDLFWGHSILVSGDLAKGPNRCRHPWLAGG